MPLWPQTVVDLAASADLLRRRHYGVIDVRDGQLVGIHLRPWPKLVSLVDVFWGQWQHQNLAGDRMRLYYNQPRRFPSFLALKFAISAKHTTLKTGLTALAALDEIARLKNSDAILCDAANFRLSPRVLAREGWTAHAPSRWHRNFIKRREGAISIARSGSLTTSATSPHTAVSTVSATVM